MPTKTPFLFADWQRLAGWNFLLGIATTIIFLIGAQILYHTGTDGKLILMMLVLFGWTYVFIQLVNLLYLFLKNMNTHVVPAFLIVLTCMFYLGDWSTFLFSLAIVLVNYALIISLLKK